MEPYSYRKPTNHIFEYFSAASITRKNDHNNYMVRRYRKKSRLRYRKRPYAYKYKYRSYKRKYSRKSRGASTRKFYNAIRIRDYSHANDVPVPYSADSKFFYLTYFD